MRSLLMKMCPDCGKRLLRIDRACNECGARFGVGDHRMLDSVVLVGGVVLLLIGVWIFRHLL